MKFEEYVCVKKPPEYVPMDIDINDVVTVPSKACDDGWEELAGLVGSKDWMHLRRSFFAVVGDGYLVKQPNKE